MKTIQTLCVLFLITCVQPGLAEESCATSPRPASDQATVVFYQTIQDRFSQVIPKLSFAGGTQGQPLTAGPYTWKIKRKSPAFGRYPDLKRARWKQQRIQLKAFVEGARFCLEIESDAYNKRDKQWHPVTVPPGFIDELLAPALFRSLEGQEAWTLGTLPAPVGSPAPGPLTRVTLSGARLAIKDVKTLFVDLQPEGESSPVSVAIPFVGDVDGVDKALAALSRHLSWSDPRLGLDRRYNFFWEYAKNGELMDGMHEQQVLVAMGRPDTMVRKNNRTVVWTYGFGKDAIQYVIRDHELVLPE